MIKTDNLSKIYSSGTKALDKLTIHVKEGEIFGFLGPNGAGKSTTIKILTTLSRPTSGNAWISGFNVLTQQNSVRSAIGYVAQETGVDYFLSGRENAVLQGRLYRMDSRSINRRVDELFELFDLKDCAGDLVSTYSGGMRRKLDIALALIHSPRIIFLDEPTIGLDPHSRSSLWSYIRMLNKDLKVTIFLTTHYLDEADKLSHRIGILHKGNIKIVDTPEALKDSIKGDSVNLSLKGAAKEKAIQLLKKSEIVKDLLCEDEHVRVYVNNGGEAIPELMKLLNSQGIDIASLTISRPSLDDVYLKYSGVSFQGSESSEGSNPWWAKWQKSGWGKKWKGSGSWDNKEETSPEGAEATGSGGEEEDWKKWAQSGENKEWSGEWQGNGKGDQDWASAEWSSKERASEEAESGSDNGNEEWKKWAQADSKGWTDKEKAWENKAEQHDTKENEGVVPGEAVMQNENESTDEKDNVNGQKDNAWQEDENKENKNEEGAWNKWGSSSDWQKWNKGGGQG